MIARFFIVAVAAWLGLGQVTQRPAAPSGAIAGRVLDARSSPVAGAVVRIAEQGRSVTADAAGRFQFSGLPAGVFELTGSKPRCDRSPGMPTFRLAVRVNENESVADVVVRVWCGATIEGRAIDDDGDPVEGVGVQLFQPDAVGTNRAIRTETTDASGRYRFGALGPGEYIVAASRPTSIDELRYIDDGGTERIGTFADVFYPGATSPSSAQPIVVAADDIRSGIDLRMMLVPCTRIEGTMEAADGRALADLRVRLIPPDDALTVPYDATVYASDGRFRFGRITAGTYQMVATAQRARPPGSEFSSDAPPDIYWGITRVASDGQHPASAPMLLERGASISGTLVIDGPPPPTTRPVRIEIASVDTASPFFPRYGTTTFQPRVDPSGRMTLTGLPPGNYIVSMPYNPDRWIKSVTVGGRDVADQPFTLQLRQDVTDVTIVAGDRVAEVSGRVLDTAGKPLNGAVVVVFTTDPRHWLGTRRAQIARTFTDGRYAVRGLAPGEYFVVAFSSGVQPILRRPQLAPYQALATRVFVDEGQVTSRDLKVVR